MVSVIPSEKKRFCFRGSVTLNFKLEVWRLSKPWHNDQTQENRGWELSIFFPKKIQRKNKLTKHIDLPVGYYPCPRPVMCHLFTVYLPPLSVIGSCERLLKPRNTNFKSTSMEHGLPYGLHPLKTQILSVWISGITSVFDRWHKAYWARSDVIQEKW